MVRGAEQEVAMTNPDAPVWSSDQKIFLAYTRSNGEIFASKIDGNFMVEERSQHMRNFVATFPIPPGYRNLPLSQLIKLFPFPVRT
jgi:hypothetical protein